MSNSTFPLPFSIYLYPTSIPSLIGGIYGLLCTLGFALLAITTKSKCDTEVWRTDNIFSCCCTKMCGVLSISLAAFPMYVYCAACFWSAVYLIDTLHGNVNEDMYVVLTNWIIDGIFSVAVVGWLVASKDSAGWGGVVASLSIAPLFLPFSVFLSLPLGSLVKVCVQNYQSVLIAFASTVVVASVLGLMMLVWYMACRRSEGIQAFPRSGKCCITPEIKEEKQRLIGRSEVYV